MDKIVIKDFEFFGYFGVFEAEKQLGQKFVFDFELNFPIQEAAKQNDLQKTVHYGELLYKLEEKFAEKKYDLIETVAEKFAEFILLEYKFLKSVKIRVKKPWAPIHRSLDAVYIEIERSWNQVFISFGSNIGNRKENIYKALELLEDKKTNINKVSKFIETKPWGYLEQDDFLNGVCEISTLLQPEELMNKLLFIESELKRERKIKWGPRTIDLDIIFFNDDISEDEHIILPHPRMHVREFVLIPLNEIAPYKIHPLYKKRVFELLDQLKIEEV
ncbi:MAG: 2-amino-4-hydroxy-6-hydroxymethyldihydropteridine diphosphokinase [Sarcina sp.]